MLDIIFLLGVILAIVLVILGIIVKNELLWACAVAVLVLTYIILYIVGRTSGGLEPNEVQTKINYFFIVR